jgi:exopolyphosphatase/guanosine-5'-triphosphate,3'-diphosphate pyrophosphatase
MIRLGTGGLDGRRLAEGAMTAAILTLSKFLRIAAAQRADEIIAAATSAVREAENGPELVAAIRRELGLRVRVISGGEEARLIHLAASYGAAIGKRSAVVIDIGGGSTEITLGTSERLALARSFKLGVIRLTERFATSDPLARRDERRLERHIRKQAGAFLQQVARRRAAQVIGTSGTILSLGALAAGLGPGDDVRNRRVERKAISRLRSKLTALTLQQRLKMPDLDPRRADLAPAGVVLLDTLLDGLDAESITLCDFALREGLILDYVQQNVEHIRSVGRYPDVRRRSVIELAERCNYLPAHAEQVARLSLALFDGTRRLHDLGAREREWLEFGALLHDIGTHITYERHHKHSYYLIKHGGLRGFAPDEVEVIGLVARYHRQATPRKAHPEFAALPHARRRVVRLLGAMVRLAEGLDRSHAQVIAGVRVARSRDGLVVRLRPAGDADLELWAAERHAAALEAALHTSMAFTVAGASSSTPSRRTHHARHTRHAARLSRASVRR